MSASDAAVAAGRLLAFALDISASPGSSGAPAEYARLIQRYLEEAPFRALFDDVVQGVGCEVTTADLNVGIVLRTQPDGPWAWPSRSLDLPWNKSFEKPHPRAARALVAIALLAYVAPSAADLDDALSDADLVLPAVGIRELERFIRDFCEKHESQQRDPSEQVDDRPLWWHWLQLPSESPTRARISRGSTTYIVHEVLAFLHARGWLIDITPNRAALDKQYRPRRRLLYHYRDLLLDEAFTALRKQAQTQGGIGDNRIFSEPAGD